MSGEKYALVTGCGKGGIGHALAAGLKNKGIRAFLTCRIAFGIGKVHRIDFHQRLGNQHASNVQPDNKRTTGFTVIATVLPHEDQEHLLSLQIKVSCTDVTSEASVLELKETVETISKGRLDVLINNAGIAYTMTAVDTDTQQAEKMFGVNVFGPMRMVRIFHRMIIAAKGRIVNIGSIGGMTPYVYGAAYNASKAALVHYGNTLRVEMLPFGVKVINIISGEVGTNILRNDLMRSLPEDSVFAPLSENFKAHVRRTPNTTSPEQYAAGVVAEITKVSPRAWFWHGKLTSMVWWMTTFLPQTAFDGIFYRDFKLGTLAGKQLDRKLE
ncbi:MAG: hypothetical protein L6R35_000744 [Caloplaca aegaea]|nr:MAG: hypothetical protein L6R35_000744 [Caloplaca aegaea]